MIKDTIEVCTDGCLISSCEYITEHTTTFYSIELNGVTEINKELYFYE